MLQHKINGLDAVAIRPEQSRRPPEMIEIIVQVYLHLAFMPTEWSWPPLHWQALFKQW